MKIKKKRKRKIKDGEIDLEAPEVRLIVTFMVYTMYIGDVKYIKSVVRVNNLRLRLILAGWHLRLAGQRAAQDPEGEGQAREGEGQVC